MGGCVRARGETDRGYFSIKTISILILFCVIPVVLIFHFPRASGFCYSGGGVN